MSFEEKQREREREREQNLSCNVISCGDRMQIFSGVRKIYLFLCAGIVCWYWTVAQSPTTVNGRCLSLGKYQDFEFWNIYLRFELAEYKSDDVTQIAHARD